MTTSNQLTFEAGKFYRTRDGRKAFLFEVADFIFGKITDYQGKWWPMQWRSDGRYNGESGNDADIIAEWSDKPEVDWSAMPAWAVAVAMDSNGEWYCYQRVPNREESCWGFNCICRITTDHCPKWTGNWKDSLVTRGEAA